MVHRARHARCRSVLYPPHRPSLRRVRRRDRRRPALTALAPPIAIAESDFYVEDIPLGLNSADARTGPNLKTLTKGANGKEIEKCATKCIATCTRGGSGAPGLGPLSVRKAPVVFKEGFRSRQYCLSECTEICSITVRDSKK